MLDYCCDGFGSKDQAKDFKEYPQGADSADSVPNSVNARGHTVHHYVGTTVSLCTCITSAGLEYVPRAFVMLYRRTTHLDDSFAIRDSQHAALYSSCIGIIALRDLHSGYVGYRLRRPNPLDDRSCCALSILHRDGCLTDWCSTASLSLSFESCTCSSLF